MSQDPKNAKAQIAIALIGLVGVLGAAAIGNWDKIVLRNTKTVSPEVIKPKLEVGPAEQPLHPQVATSPRNLPKPGNGGSAPDLRTTTPKASTILLRADLASIVAIDGHEIGRLRAGETTVRSVGAGEHFIEAKVPELSLYWQKTVAIDDVRQVIVETELRTLLDERMSGTFGWDANHNTADGCRFITDAWMLDTPRGRDPRPLSEKFIRLSRNIGIQDESPGPASCKIMTSLHCLRSFRLQLSSPDPGRAGLHFVSVTDSQGPNLITVPGIYNAENAARFCEQAHSLPLAGFTGTLTLVSDSQIKLKIDSPSVELILTKR